jgi:hypothetical protein
MVMAATPRLDHYAAGLIKRIPTEFETAFTPGAGTELPNSYLLTKEAIMLFVNRAILKLFNDVWKASMGNADIFAGMLPELIKPSGLITLSSGSYKIANPYLDFKRAVGAYTESGKFIKIKDSTKYVFYKTGVYDELSASADKPALIHIADYIHIFPATVTEKIIVHYIQLPVNPTTGKQLSQNGEYDSPFTDQWDEEIITTAYQLYLQEAGETI